MGKLSTVFSDETRSLIHRVSMKLHGSNRVQFICEAERELWDFMPFDWDDIAATVNKVFKKYCSDDSIPRPRWEALPAGVSTVTAERRDDVQEQYGTVY